MPKRSKGVVGVEAHLDFAHINKDVPCAIYPMVYNMYDIHCAKTCPFVLDDNMAPFQCCIATLSRHIS